MLNNCKGTLKEKLNTFTKKSTKNSTFKEKVLKKMTLYSNQLNTSKFQTV